MKAKLIRKFKKGHMRLKCKTQKSQARSRISWFVKINQPVAQADHTNLVN